MRTAAGLAGMTNLQTLGPRPNQITDICRLSGLPALLWLDLDGNGWLPSSSRPA